MTPSQEIPETNDNFQENRGVMMSLSVQNSRAYRVTFPRAVRSVIYEGRSMYGQERKELIETKNPCTSINPDRSHWTMPIN
jgi:hypothetical protein